MSHTSRISTLKLESLKRRQGELAAGYDALAGADPRAVARALAALRSGAERLHPEAESVAALADMDPSGALSGATLEAWRPSLEREIAQGRARADHSLVFGAIVDEWVKAPPPADPCDPWPALRAAWEATPSVDVAWMDRVVAKDPVAWEKLRATLAEFVADEASEVVHSSDVVERLQAIASSPYRAEALRSEATRVARNPTLVAEYASSLSLMVQEVDRWRWPAEGVAARTARAYRTDRVYLDEDLLTAVFLETVGARWAYQLRGSVAELWMTRLTADLRPNWRSPVYVELGRRATWSCFATATGDGGQSHYVRADAVMDSPDELESWLATVSAFFLTERAFFPDVPTRVTITDVPAHGPSLPHAAALAVLERLGVSAAWRAFFGEFLRARVIVGGAVRECPRGVFPDHLLGLVLADLVLSMVDLDVHDRTGVRLVRMLDDVAIVSADAARADAAWSALTEDLAALGLSTRPDKTGTTLVGGPPESAKAHAGLVALGADGAWTIDEERFTAERAALLADVAAATSVLGGVHAYSAGARAMLRRMWPFSYLGRGHVTELARRLGSVTEEALASLRARVERLAPGASVPRATFFWPRTAGGLGMFCVASQLVALWSAPAKPTFPLPPHDEDEDMGAWTHAVNSLTQRPQPRRPSMSSALEARIVDFVRRGDELRGETTREKDIDDLVHRLHFYWQWVVALHGPELLERFGTFRFVEAARIPLGLLVDLDPTA